MYVLGECANLQLIVITIVTQTSTTGFTKVEADKLSAMILSFIYQHHNDVIHPTEQSYLRCTQILPLRKVLHILIGKGSEGKVKVKTLFSEMANSRIRLLQLDCLFYIVLLWSQQHPPLRTLC